MSTKAELIKYSLMQIQIYELMLEKDPDNAALKELLERERITLDKIEKS